MARKGYSPEFRRRVVELVESGRKVAEAAADLGITAPVSSHNVAT